ncbi:MAG TPA: type II toxin-antitoxin system RelE/ParE family toxin [Nitrososphaera sp.]|jgi:plasmid stabilization system protein ParE|nr:type II toxin-antitoxin system RelE/ParE family toxin [Nitrososphaera sp.]
MTYKVIVRPEAEREIQEAFDWYEERSEGLGAEFLRTADACLSGVQRNPEAYQLVHSEVRRVLLRRFPYALFYLVREDTIIVLACFHIKRSPADWQRRI